MKSATRHRHATDGESGRMGRRWIPRGGVDVHTEKYTLPVTWSEGDTRLELIAPEQFPVRVVSTGWSPATPAGGIEASLIDIAAQRR